MKRLILFVLLALLTVNLCGVQLVGAEEPAVQPKEEKLAGDQIKLTETQIKELSKLYEDIFKRKKKLINKYVEYGIISQEKGERIIRHMEKHLQYVKEHGYLPMKHKHCGHDHHHDRP